MKPRIGVYLSEQMAARLAAAAKRPRASESALVEAALAQFYGSDDDRDNLPVDRRLSLMSRQLEQLVPPFSSRYVGLPMDGLDRIRKGAAQARYRTSRLGCAGASTQTGATPSRISVSRLPWRGSARWTKRGLPYKQALRSISFSLSRELFDRLHQGARSLVIGSSCCAKSEDRATAVGAASFSATASGAACVRGAGAEGAIIAVERRTTTTMQQHQWMLPTENRRKPRSAIANR